MKHNDVYHWRYNKKKLEELRDDNNGGTTYWCCSCIGRYNADRMCLSDTYWGCGDSKTFTKEEIERDLELTFIANFDDLKTCHNGEYDYYDDADCINLSHVNHGGQYYLKKDAKKSIKKMRSVVERNIKEYEHNVSFNQGMLERAREKLKGLTIEDYI